MFLHGFYASGQCVPARALRDAFAGRARVIAPDLPFHPKEALSLIRDICDRERPDALVGNSCGSFYAQMVAPVAGIPALLGNPHFRMADFLKLRTGEQTYKSPRRDGMQQFVVDETLVAEFAELEQIQFDHCNPYYKDKVWGLFGEQDTLARFEPVFLEHYDRAYRFPGGHTPTATEVRAWYAPLVGKLMAEYPKPEDGIRYFRHFEGGMYRYVRTDFDPETKERMVVCQALRGERQYSVFPEKMFFGTVERDGRKSARFTETDKGRRYGT